MEICISIVRIKQLHYTEYKNVIFLGGRDMMGFLRAISTLSPREVASNPFDQIGGSYSLSHQGLISRKEFVILWSWHGNLPRLIDSSIVRTHFKITYEPLATSLLHLRPTTQHGFLYNQPLCIPFGRIGGKM